MDKVTKFDGVDREHVEKALRAIDKPWPDKHDPAVWWIKVGRTLYPLKYAVLKSIQHAPGVDLNSSDFTPIEAVRLLKRLGFEVVKKQ